MPKKKIKIAYISIDSFFDVDFPILPELNKDYELVWHPIIGKSSSRYSENDVKRFADNNSIKYLLHIRKGRRRDLRQLPFTLNLIKTIKKSNPDIIYSEYFGDIYLAFLGVLMFPKNKTIYAIHDVSSHTNFGNFIGRMSKNFVRRNLKYFQLFSKNQKLVFDSIYNNKSTFYVPLALKNFGKSNMKVPSIEEGCKFLFFGSILEYKGLDLLISAVEELVEEGYSNFSITIAGKGIFWEQCKKLIKNQEFYSTNINFIPDSQIPDLFCNHHFLVLPYLDVTQSGPQMIALNYGLPIIASNHAGFREYIDEGKTGYLFKSSSKIELKTKLKKAISHSELEYSLLKENLFLARKENYDLLKIIQLYNVMFNTIYES